VLFSGKPFIVARHHPIRSTVRLDEVQDENERNQDTPTFDTIANPPEEMTDLVESYRFFLVICKVVKKVYEDKFERKKQSKNTCNVYSFQSSFNIRELRYEKQSKQKQLK